MKESEPEYDSPQKLFIGEDTIIIFERKQKKCCAAAEVTVKANIKSSGRLFQQLGVQTPKAATADFQLTLSNRPAPAHCRSLGGL